MLVHQEGTNVSHQAGGRRGEAEAESTGTQALAQEIKYLTSALGRETFPTATNERKKASTSPWFKMPPEFPQSVSDYLDLRLKYLYF